MSNIKNSLLVILFMILVILPGIIMAFNEPYYQSHGMKAGATIKDVIITLSNNAIVIGEQGDAIILKSNGSMWHFTDVNNLFSETKEQNLFCEKGTWRFKDSNLIDINNMGELELSIERLVYNEKNKFYSKKHDSNLTCNIKIDPENYGIFINNVYYDVSSFNGYKNLTDYMKGQYNIGTLNYFLYFR